MAVVIESIVRCPVLHALADYIEDRALDLIHDLDAPPCRVCVEAGAEAVVAGEVKTQRKNAPFTNTMAAAVMSETVWGFVHLPTRGGGGLGSFTGL